MNPAPFVTGYLMVMSFRQVRDKLIFSSFYSGAKGAG
jgi:hypothetical protein